MCCVSSPMLKVVECSLVGFFPEPSEMDPTRSQVASIYYKAVPSSWLGNAQT